MVLTLPAYPSRSVAMILTVCPPPPPPRSVATVLTLSILPEVLLQFWHCLSSQACFYSSDTVYPPRSVSTVLTLSVLPGVFLQFWHCLSSQECCYSSDTVSPPRNVSTVLTLSILPGVLLWFWHCLSSQECCYGSDTVYPPRSVAMVLTGGTGLRTTSWSWRRRTLGLPWPTTRPTGPWGRTTSVTTGTAMMPAASGHPRSRTANSSTSSGQLGSVGPTYPSDSVSGALDNMEN